MTMSSLQNPFVGLRPYQSSDSLFYFGRNEQTKTLLRLLHQHRFVTVVGSSGAGKSSLIRAGLIPQLEAGFLVQARDQWLVASTKPGDSPLSNLISSLLEALPQKAPGEQANQDLEQLIEAISDNGTQALIQHLEPILANSDTNLFILVDQFEELFRFGLEKGQSRNRQEAEQYVALLLSLSRNDLPIYVCLTMRSDFLGDCDAFYGLPEAINKSQFLVPRLTRSQRQEVITHPVNLAGAKISQRLVDKLLNENIDTRDDLPILQHALMRTWDNWQAQGAQGELDVQHYENIHTIHEALDRHADEALEELATDEQKHIAKVLFQALTTVDAGNRWIRRPVHLDEACAISGASPEAVMQVIECFCEKSRSFLVLSSNESADNPLIDISHESLIRQWKTLDQWVEEENEAADTYARLVASSQRYQENKADLLRHVELEQALTWQKQLPKGDAAEIWAKRYDKHFTEANEFLQLSQAAHIQKLAEEREAQEHQAKLLKEKVELEEQKRVLAEQQAAEQKKSLIKTRWLSGIMAVLTIVMLGVAWFAMQQSTIAKQKELDANYNLAKAFEEKSQFSISKGNSITRGDSMTERAPFSPRAKSEYRNALLYALEAQKRQLANNRSAILPASLMLTSMIPESAIESERYQTPHLSIGSITTITESSNGEVIATGSYDNTIQLWNAQTGRNINTLIGHSETILAITFSPDSKIVASGAGDKTIRLWNTLTGNTVNILKGHTSHVQTVAYSPSGKIIASGSSDKTIRLWNAQSGEAINTLTGHSGSVYIVSYSPDGKVIASGSNDGTIRLWNVQSGELMNTLLGHSDSIYRINYSSDSKVISSDYYDDTIRRWNVQSGEVIDHNPESKVIVASSDDRSLWNALSGEAIKGHSSSVNAVAYSPDGKVIASSSDDDTIRLWNAQTGVTIKTLSGHADSVLSIAYSPNGKVIASGSNDNTIRLWNAQTGELIKTLSGHADSVLSIAYSPNGKVIASGSDDHTIRLWNAQSGKTINILKGRPSSDLLKILRSVRAIAYSPDGKTITSGSDDGTIRLWDTDSGENTRTIEEDSGSVSAVTYSPDGKIIASASLLGIVRLWDAQSGETIKTLNGNSSSAQTITYSPDGKFIATGDDDGIIRLWNAKSGKIIKTLKGHSGPVNTVAYSLDGKIITSGSDDNTIRFWHAPRPSEAINTFKGHSGHINTIAYSPDGKIIASGADDSTVRFWSSESGKVINTLKGHSSSVLTIAYSPDGKFIASGSDDNTIRFWSTQSGEPINTLGGHSGSVRSIAYSPDGKALASGSDDNTIRLWNTQSGKTTRILAGHSSAVRTVAYSPDGKIIASGSNDSTIRLWNTQSGEIIKTLRGHFDSIFTIAFSPNGKFIASGSRDSSIRLWNVLSGENFNTIEGQNMESIKTIVYSTDGKTITAGSDYYTRLLDAQSGEAIHVKDSIPALTISYSPDGKTLVSGYYNGTIQQWRFGSPLFRFVYDFDAIEVSNVLRFLWELELEDLNFKHTPRPQSLITEMGYHIAWTDKTRKYRPLLDMPDGDDTKMDQVVKWLEKRCAYKQPERYNCTPAKETEASPN